MKMLMLIFLTVTACGQDENSKDDNSKNETQSLNPPSEVTSQHELQSLSLDKKEDLPDCAETNQHQLAYIISEASFYVCEVSWRVILIKGEAGKDGAKGDTGTTGETANSSNLWHDPISNVTYLLGGEANWNSANQACAGLYKLPTEGQGVAAGLHGIRAIAQALGLKKDFWTSGVGIYIGLDNSGSPAALPTSSANAFSIFCVRN